MATSGDLAAATLALAAEVLAVHPDANVEGWAVYRLPPSTWALVDVVPRESFSQEAYSLIEPLGPTKGDALVKLESMIAGISLARQFDAPTD